MVSTKVAIGSVGLIMVVSSLAWVKHYKVAQKEAAKNFQPRYLNPVGWVAQPHGPTTLFKFADPTTKLILKGAVNQVISETNPTPDMDTDGIAQFYVDRTKESMPEWTAAKIGNYQVGTTDFDVVRRSTKDRVVVTAYVVRGNTTLLITLFGEGKTRPMVDSNLKKLYSFLDTVSLNERDMSSM